MKSILLIEDDPFLVEIYTTKLKEAGFSIKAVIEGDNGLKKIKESSPALLLLDIVLPNINGWEILRDIQKDEKLKNLK